MKQFLDQVALHTEHHDATRIEALMDMCRAAIAVYDGTEDQAVADWALSDHRGRGARLLASSWPPKHLNRSEEGRAEVLAEVEALRADLQLMRTQVGSAIGVDLVQP